MVGLEFPFVPSDIRVLPHVQIFYPLMCSCLPSHSYTCSIRLFPFVLSHPALNISGGIQKYSAYTLLKPAFCVWERSYLPPPQDLCTCYSLVGNILLLPNLHSPSSFSRLSPQLKFHLSHRGFLESIEMATTTLTCCCLLSHNVLIALSMLCSHLDGSACSFPISHQYAVSASWSLCRSTQNGHSTQEAFRLENVICGMSLPFHFTQLCHQNEIPRNEIILPEGSLYARYRAPRSGQCIQKQPVFPA